MMVDSGPAAEPGAAANASPEKDRAGNGDYACGGWKSEDGSLTCGYSSFRGQRVSMEDYCDLKSTKIDGHTVHLFGIFDGHGGSHAAEYLKEHLFENLMRHPQFMSDTKLALSTNRLVKLLGAFIALICCSFFFFLSPVNLFNLGFSCQFSGETYKKTDSDFLAAESNTSRDDGSTASTAVLIGKHLYVANVGDSRVVISKTGKAIPLSNDHKPNRSDERKRIEDAGGVVTWTGTWRVGGILAMSRAFGNRLLKQFVVAEPEIQEQVVDEELEILVLASDGLWDVVANEDAVSLVRVEEEPEAAARKLMETAFSRGSADNITCIVVRFHHDKFDVDQSPPPPPNSYSGLTS